MYREQSNCWIYSREVSLSISLISVNLKHIISIKVVTDFEGGLHITCYSEFRMIQLIKIQINVTDQC